MRDAGAPVHVLMIPVVTLFVTYGVHMWQRHRQPVHTTTEGFSLFDDAVQYNKHPNDLIYKTLLLARTVTKLGPRALVTIDDITRLHAQDVRAFEYSVYRITYGEDAIPEPDDSDPGG